MPADFLALAARVLGIVAPVFLIVGLGYGWGRRGRAFDTDFISTLVFNLGAPALVFSALIKAAPTPAAVALMAGAGAAAIASFTAIGYAVLRALGWPVRSFLPSLIFPNTGGAGLPVSLLAFGEPGLALAAVIFTLNSALQFTLGLGIAAGGMALGQVARLPHLYAIAAALAFHLTDVAAPAWLTNTADLLAGFTIPFMLLMLGLSLARLPLRGLRRSVVLALLRIAMGIGVGLGLGVALGLDRVAAGVLAIMCSMPPAILSYLFALRYGNHPEEVAGINLAANVVSLVTLPALLVYVL
jgi:predicted permease